MRDRLSEEIDAVIANGNRIIREAEAALAESERRFAELNFSPREALARLKRLAGDAVGHEVEAEAAATVQRIQESIQASQPSGAKQRPPARRSRVRNMI
ncbi:MAG: hypothetical protein Q8R82_07450 [Hyphomonadaceae bacterium]|nr:hypothetical protein [Hyphomonadaceae bacterium]